MSTNHPRLNAVIKMNTLILLIVISLSSTFCSASFAQVSTNTQKASLEELKHQVSNLELRDEERLRFAEEGLRLSEKIYGPDHDETWFFVKILEEFYRRQGRMEEYVRFAKRNDELSKKHMQRQADHTNKMLSDPVYFDKTYLEWLREDKNLRHLSDEELMNLTEEDLRKLAAKNMTEIAITSNDSIAESTLRAIETAIHSYESRNKRFPLSEKELLNANPPYLNRSYEDKVYNGYVFYYDLYPDKYEITARPEQCGITGMRIFKIKDSYPYRIQEECK